ncbi:MAG: GTPase, partial [Peptostreptococcaceae bacterium]
MDNMYGSRYEELEKIMDIINDLQSAIEILNLNIDNAHKNNSTKLMDDIQIVINKNIESVKELKNPFLLFIMGCGNYGKSTLINVLLNKIVVQTNDIPNTWKLDLFIKSSKELMEITYKDSTKKRTSLRQGSRFLQIEEDKIRKSKTEISKNINIYKRSNEVSIKELKKYKTELEQRELYNSNIEQIKYYIDCGNVLNDFIIVDTPGLNQTLLKNTMNRMKEYYTKSDGIIWLIDAQNLVSNENNKLIEEINKIDNIHSTNKKIIAVVNKIDIISKYNKTNIEKVKMKANNLFKDKFCDIVYISAKQALDGIFNCDYDLIEKSNIDELYSSIEKNFTKVCEINQIESKYKNLYIMKDDILYKIYEYKRELYKEISVYN